MATPSTPVLDDFNRTGGGAPLGSNWTTLPLAPGGNAFLAPRIGTNDFISAASGRTAAALWTVSSFGANQEAYMKILSRSGYLGLFVRCTGATARADSYAITFAQSDGLKLYRWDAGTPTQMGSTLTGVTWAAGDEWLLQAVGSQISVYRKPAAGSWPSTPTLTVTDRTYSAGGYIGAITESSNSSLDDFGGGSLVISVALGQAVETDAAESLSLLNPPALAQVGTTEVALALAPAKRVALGLAT